VVCIQEHVVLSGKYNVTERRSKQ